MGGCFVIQRNLARTALNGTVVAADWGWGGRVGRVTTKQGRAISCATAAKDISVSTQASETAVTIRLLPSIITEGVRCADTHT